MKRRTFLMQGALAMGAAAIADAPGLVSAAIPDCQQRKPGPMSLLAQLPPHLFDFTKVVKDPVKVASVELLKADGNYFVRARSTEGVEAVIIANERVSYFWPILEQRIVPHFVGRDARDFEAITDELYRADSNYKLAGLALWCCVGYMDFALLELMGQTSGKSVGALLGGVRKREFPAYLSSTRRDTTAEQEVEWITPRIAETKATAVKFKIGGRMSNNADVYPGRSETLVALARKTWGDRMVLYVDSNGSYDAPKAIEVGKMLEAHNVAFFEEPCPFEDYEATKKVADALKIPVACGEQDSNLLRFAEMIRDRALDIVQPDMNYNGGLIRACKVAKMAEAVGIPVIPHSPQPMPQAAYVLQFASRTPNFGPHFEYPARLPKKAPDWFTPDLTIENGVVPVPPGPGFGVRFDPALLKKAEILFTVKGKD
jgi:L-alanine-DL-glutamate epimerase-like enolase superfamily enzyme